MLKKMIDIGTVGELKQWLADVPDSTPIGRQTKGYYRINKIGDVSFWVGEVDVTTGKIGETTPMTMLSIGCGG
jgi:hypothetical protein